MIMIDWVSLLIPLYHSCPINAGNVVSIDPDGNVEWNTEKRLSVEGSYGANIQIRSDHSKGYCTAVRLDGNPVKWLQGHNVWGSDDLLGLMISCLSRVIALIPDVYNELIEKSVKHLIINNVSGVKNNEISDIQSLCNYLLPYVFCSRLTRIDLTAMYDLGNQQHVLTWLRSAAESANMAYRGRGHFRGDTLYWGQNSRRWSLKMYPKGLELKAHKPKKGVTDHPHYLDGVTDFANKALRVELTLRGMELDRLGLSSVQHWRDGTIETVYNGYLKGLEFSQNMKVTDALPELDKLPARLRGALIAWHSGHDLRVMYPRASFYRYRNEILSLVGIDVSLPLPVSSPDRPSNVIPLITVLEAKPMSVPAWAKGTQLYFEPPVYKIGIS